jgi:hypothetical protein
MAVITLAWPARSLGRSAPEVGTIAKEKESTTSGTGVTLGVRDGVALFEGVTDEVADGVCEGVRVSEGVVEGVCEGVTEMVLDGEAVTEGVTLGVDEGGVTQTLLTAS